MTMTEDELSPAERQRVRRLLADARHDAPMPADVAERLDRVLLRLQSDDEDVIELTARRRRRVRLGIVAAAGVLVAGVALGQVIGPRDQESTTSADSTGQAGSADQSTREDSADGGADGGELAAEADEEQADGSAEESAGDDAADQASPDSTEFSSGTGATVAPYDTILVSGDRIARVRPGTFGADAARLQRALRRSTPLAASGKRIDRASFDCLPGTYGRGRLVAVTYRGEPAVLAFRPPVGATQVVDLILCGGDQPLRSVTLPRP